MSRWKNVNLWGDNLSVSPSDLFFLSLLFVFTKDISVAPQLWGNANDGGKNKISACENNQDGGKYWAKSQ